MIKSIHQYVTEEVCPRIVDILTGSEFILSVLLSAAIAIWGDKVLFGSVKMEQISTALLTYSAIALGFCIAGLTLVLTLPNSEFTKKLSESKLDPQVNNGRDAYSDLLFVLSWAAICHWLIIVVVILAIVFNGFDTKIFDAGPSVYRRVGVGITAFVSLYGLFQFLIVLITLSQVGRVYIAEIKKKGKPKK